MKKFLLIIFLSGTFLVYSEQTGLKPRVARREKMGDAREKIATEFEKVLTTSSSLIASLSEVIETVVKKIKALASGDDAFFAHRKAAQLEQYKKRLEKMRTTVQMTLDEVKKELHNLEKNFEL